MLDSRKVVGRRGQLLVPLGARVRDHLGVGKGDQVYWHIGRKGDASLTASPMRPGGRASPNESCPNCAALDKQVRELTGQLHSRRAGEGRQYFNQCYMTAARTVGTPAADFGALVDMVKSIRADLPRRRQRRPIVVQANPSLSAPPSSDVSAGEAATPGAQPTGGP